MKLYENELYNKKKKFFLGCNDCYYRSTENYDETQAIETHNFIATCIEEKIRRTMDGKHD